MIWDLTIWIIYLYRARMKNIRASFKAHAGASCDGHSRLCPACTGLVATYLVGANIAKAGVGLVIGCLADILPIT